MIVCVLLELTNIGVVSQGMLFAESNRWQSGQDPATVNTDPFVSCSPL